MLDNRNRVYMYAFLSRVFSDPLDDIFLSDLKNNSAILEMIGDSTLSWFDSTDQQRIISELNVDFSTVFLMHAKPFETSVIDSKDEILVGLQNPVMQFYFSHNFELNLSNSNIQTPDHISIELSFMQNLISSGDTATQKEFLKKHILNWFIPYLIGIKEMFTTPFYRDLVDFSIEFLCSDYEQLKEVK
jgi:TorA maturation chaperone TorD